MKILSVFEDYYDGEARTVAQGKVWARTRWIVDKGAGPGMDAVSWNLMRTLMNGPQRAGAPVAKQYREVLTFEQTGWNIDKAILVLGDEVAVVASLLERTGGSKARCVHAQGPEELVEAARREGGKMLARAAMRYVTEKVEVTPGDKHREMARRATLWQFSAEVLRGNGSPIRKWLREHDPVLRVHLHEPDTVRIERNAKIDEAGGDRAWTGREAAGYIAKYLEECDRRADTHQAVREATGPEEARV